MKLPFQCLVFLFAVFLAPGRSQKKTGFSKTGTIKITFLNVVDKQLMVLDSSVYANPFGETYSITKFKYYISNVNLHGTGNSAVERESCHLVDQREPESLSFSFDAEENTFSTLQFLAGVDSIHNVSGAQSGALDPLNDMFWTWNSGYVMTKMEGISPQSKQAGNRFEYHIGGFSGVNNVLKEISLALPSGKKLVVKPGQTSEIIVATDFDKWWQSPNDLKITDIQICTTPGALAKKIADNYCKMFTVTDVINN